jgi:subtilisin family serine protease
VLALLAAIVAGSASGLSPASAGAPDPGATAAASTRVSPAVNDALAQGGRVRVNIALAAPGAAPNSRAGLAQRASAAQAGVLGRVAPADLAVIHQYRALPALTGTVSAAAVAKLAADPDVLSVTLDGTGAAAAAVAPPDAPAATHALSRSVPMIHADLVHGNGITGSGVTVAILDSGADTDHPDLADSISGQECFLSGSGTKCPNGTMRQSGTGAAEDDNGHGTNVAGIVTSNGVVSSVGVAPGASVLVYKILNAAGTGLFSDWDAALDDIIANHPEVKVINMSLASFATFSSSCGTADPVATMAFQTLNNAGVSLFVASGNNGVKNAITFPACVPGAIAVGAVYDQTLSSSTFFGCTDTPATIDVPTCWSNSATGLLDLLAPGTFIVSDGVGGGTSTYIGTSQASPHAAGVAALMLQHEPGLTPSQVEARLKDSGVPRTDPANGLTTPRIDAEPAVFHVPSVGGSAVLPDLAPRRTGGGHVAALPAALVATAFALLGGGAAAILRRRRGDRASE